eukprot:3001422-Prymnesium_polylepis.1
MCRDAESPATLSAIPFPSRKGKCIELRRGCPWGQSKLMALFTIAAVLVALLLLSANGAFDSLGQTTRLQQAHAPQHSVAQAVSSTGAAVASERSVARSERSVAQASSPQGKSSIQPIARSASVTAPPVPPPLAPSRNMFVNQNPLNWIDAKLACESFGGNLVTILDATKNAEVLDLIWSGGQAWVGLNDQTTQGVYEWARSDYNIPLNSTNYADWISGEPATTATQPWGYTSSGSWEQVTANADCGAITSSGSTSNHWLMAYCNATYRSVCEGAPSPPGCSDSYCTSTMTGSAVGYDCWAGSLTEPCSCSQGSAHITGETRMLTVAHFGDTTGYNVLQHKYTCCNSGAD